MIRTARAPSVEPLIVFRPHPERGILAAMDLLEYWKVGEQKAQSAMRTTALRNFNAFCVVRSAEPDRSEAVDLLKDTRLAREHPMISLPTLAPELPELFRKAFGDPANTERMLDEIDGHVLEHPTHQVSP